MSANKSKLTAKKIHTAHQFFNGRQRGPFLKYTREEYIELIKGNDPFKKEQSIPKQLTEEELKQALQELDTLA